jgi:hypothetical protein
MVSLKSDFTRGFQVEPIVAINADLYCSHESNTSFLDVEEEGWCLKLPCVVPDDERTETWPG